MDNFLPLLRKSPLFDSIDEDSLQKLCKCLSSCQKKLPKDDFVFHAGDEARFVYLILQGSMYILSEDFWGNRSIIENIPCFTLFGEAYALASTQFHLVSVRAAEDSLVLQIDPRRLFDTCANRCACHLQLIHNTAYILSEKIVLLTQKLGHVSQRTLREKILSYLSQCAWQQNSSSFSIPYSRQELADYLCVDRSALSHELSRMRTAGLLDYRKSSFTLLEKP